MLPFVVLCFVLLSPCILGSVENCTAAKCLRCIPSVIPNCTVSQIDQRLYNVYCEPPFMSSICTEVNVTNAFCFALVDIVNANGQWKYQSINFPFQNHHTNCSNIGGNAILPNCLHLYSEVTSVEQVGHNIFCRCYEDDCQKRINVTFRVTGNINNGSDGTPITSTISSVSAELSIMSTTSIVQNYDTTPLLITSSSLDNGTPISLSLRTSLSTTFINMSISDNLNLLASSLNSKLIISNMFKLFYLFIHNFYVYIVYF